MIATMRFSLPVLVLALLVVGCSKSNEYEIAALKTTLEQQQDTLAQQQDTIAQQQDTIATRQSTITDLQLEIEDLEKDLESTTYASSYDPSKALDRKLANILLGTVGFSTEDLLLMSRELDKGSSLSEISSIFNLTPEDISSLQKSLDDAFSIEGEGSSEITTFREKLSLLFSTGQTGSGKIKHTSKSSSIGSRAFWSEFDANEDAAERRYRGIRVHISGTLESVRLKPNGIYSADLIEDPSVSSDVHIDFDESQRISIARCLGKDIVISAVIKEGFDHPLSIMGHVGMKDGKFVEAH
jgi:hypothetical protein